MREFSPTRRTFWVAYGVLLLGIIFLGARSERTVAAVLSGAWGSHASVQPSRAQAPDATSRLEAKDSLLVAAELSGRDPFRAPPSKKKPVQKRKAQPTRPKVEPNPTLKTLIFDNVDPTVQLRINDETSEWLHVGDVFKGWTVVEIAAKSVLVIKKDQSLIVHSF